MAAHPSVLPFLIYIKVAGGGGAAAERAGAQKGRLKAGQGLLGGPAADARPPLARSPPRQNEGKHMERMAVRAKYMTLDPNKNRWGGGGVGSGPGGQQGLCAARP
jgi:hypothetical protein